MAEKSETIKSKIWFEDAAEDNPFAADACYCSGYDVYGDLLGKISWVEYLYLLFKLELPDTKQAKLLEMIAVAIANPGIRDNSVRAAMNAGVGGSTGASALMAAIAVGAGNLGGGREVLQMLRWWGRCGTDLKSWVGNIDSPTEEDDKDIWHPMEHVPGFDPHGVSCPGSVRDALTKLAAASPGGKLPWLDSNRRVLESAAGYPLAMSGVIATGLADLGFEDREAELLFLLLRLPGAAVHSLEQERYGWQQYPFFGSVVKPMSDKEYWTMLDVLGAGT